jgi:hypothetical protein
MSIAELLISIANKIKGIKDNVLAAYDAIAVKGGEVPEEKSTENLPATISKLQVKKPEVPIRSVTFIDFDGTVLYSYSVKEYAQLTELPAGPTHWEHLNFIGWTHTLEETQNNREQIIGAMYELKEPDKSYCTIVVSNNECVIRKDQHVDMYVDWGDGSPVEYCNDGAYTQYPHYYEKNGEYEICIWGGVYNYIYISCPINYSFVKLDGNTPIIRTTAKYLWCPDKVTYSNYTAAVIYRLTENLGTFASFTGLEWLVCNDKVTATSINISSSARLKGCNFNDNITSIASRQNLNCFQLCRLPNNSTFKMPVIVGSGLKELYIPNSITTLGNSVTTMPNNAQKIHIMRSVVKDGDITTMAFNFASNLGNSNIAISFYVPADSLEAYKTATNWSALADRIFPEEE